MQKMVHDAKSSWGVCLRLLIEAVYSISVKHGGDFNAETPLNSVFIGSVTEL